MITRTTTSNIHKEKSETSPRVKMVDAPLSRSRNLILAFILIFITATAYQPAWNGKLLWDDDAHITRSDLRSLEGLGRIWTHLGVTQQYYPLVHSVFWLEYKLWNDKTIYYHLVNILLHVFSALVLIRILRSLAIPGAWVIGAVFALHPIQVESVAWITELKNTLSGVFFFLATFWYLQFDAKRKGLPYVLSLSFFIFGLLSKSVIAMLPVSLLAIVWWRQGKLELKHDISPMAPFFLLGILSGLFTAWMERTFIIGNQHEFTFSFLERCLIAGRAFWFYLAKLLWPGELIFVYPRWHIVQSQIWQYVFPLGIVILAGICWVLRKQWRFPLAVFIFFAANLFPVMGFFDVYPFMFSFVADHFQYLACIGPITLTVTGLEHAIGKRQRQWLYVGSFMLIGLLWLLTWKQSALYSDSGTLFRAVLKKNDNCWLAYNNLGLLSCNKGNGTEALAYFKKALEINPNFPKIHFNVGTMMIQMGNVNDAIEHFRKAAEIDPAYFEAFHNLAGAFATIGLTDSAIACYRKALEINPKFAESSFNLANIYSQTGKYNEAIAYYQKTVESKPDFVDAHSNLGILFAETGNTDEAILHFKKALEINPLNIDVQNNLGTALSQLGRMDEAVAHFRSALEINPLGIIPLKNLALAYQQTGRREEAMAMLSKATVLAKSTGNDSLTQDIGKIIDKIRQ